MLTKFVGSNEMAEEVKQTQNSEVVEAKPTDLAQDNKNANAQKKDKDKKPKVEKEKTENNATDEMSNNITQRINKAYKQSDSDEFDAGVKIKKEQNESEEK